MLVYGDRAALVGPRERLAEIRALLRLRAEPGPCEIEDRRRAALIMAGELAQGLIDAEFEGRGQVDDLTLVGRGAMALCISLAGAKDPAPCLDDLGRLPLPNQVLCKEPEGFSFYAVYPEAYAQAARAVAWIRPPLVVGLRSIGTTLAAAVAAAIETAGVITLRPHGHPFDRRITVSPAIEAMVRSHQGEVLVADEGPGLSGSSLMAAAELLEALGVEASRVVLAPSHPGEPGSRMTPARRRRWRGFRRIAVSFETPLTAWFADLIDETATVVDLSGGEWRNYRADGRAIPAQPAWERRKFRIETAQGVFLAKFAGLGTRGWEKFDRARRLFQAGFAPEPLALRRGFLLEPWLQANPANFFGPDRSALLDRAADYLAFRAQAFRTSQPGARPQPLREMARINAAELFGRSVSELDRMTAPLDSAALTPIAVDGRLHAWEWLRLPDGRLLKTDALDHASGHDLIGPQDAAWDVAGAAVEFGLDDYERKRLAHRVAQARGRAIDPAVLRAFEVCYCAFQGGAWQMALDSAPAVEQARIAARRDLYAERLEALSSNTATTRLQPAEAPRIFTGKQMTS